MNQGSSFQPGAASMPTSTIELAVQCRDLPNRDVMSKSDPVCVLYINHQGRWYELGRTEQIKDSLNPSWQKKFVVDYKFEERQTVKFVVYDVDCASAKVDDHDNLGSLECSLGEIVSTQSRGFEKKLKENRGKILVQAEELSGNKEIGTFKFSARSLDKKDFFGASDPYLEISRANENNVYTVVYRSEIIKNTLNPEWKEFKCEVRALCNGDYDRDLKCTVFDWDSDGSHDLIGIFHTNMRKLSKGPCPENVYDCINDKKRQKKGSKYKNSGTVILNSILIEEQPSFLDFIKGGTQVNFTLAVDFTGSNGNPNDQRSLHYRNPTGAPNQYVTAIQAVGGIIQDYDSDKMFPSLGFGARIPPSGQVSHEFFLTLDPSNPYCSGIDGILAAYYKSLGAVQLYGPTNFSPVINHVAQFAAVYQNDPTNYFVLLIITDGIITDFEDTKRAIIASSALPMSIIIIGVGDEDFSAMDALDSDDRLLRCGGLIAKRDMVQFVELRKFLQPGYGWSKEHLAREVLAEIPAQLTSWMKSKGFRTGQAKVN